jgi:hypothetical protein
VRNAEGVQRRGRGETGDRIHDTSAEIVGFDRKPANEDDRLAIGQPLLVVLGASVRGYHV